jgi:hypothetical protein
MSDSKTAALEKLQEIPLPPPVAYTPQTIGWLVVAVMLVAIAAYVCWRAYKRHASNRYRRAALAELNAIEQRAANPKQRAIALAGVPALVKRTALACEPRAQVASLTDAQWLAFLDKTLAPGSFTSGVGAMLPGLAYDDQSHIPDDQVGRLMRLLRRWIEQHHAGV